MNKLLDLNIFRGEGVGISDLKLVVAKIRCLRWPGRVVRMKERYEIKASKLSKLTCIERKKLKQRWERVGGEVVGTGVEEKWSRLKENI